MVLDPVSVNVNGNRNIILSCSATGYPVPTITWHYNGAAITAMTNVEITNTSSYYQVNSTLTVKMPTVNNTGNYSCTATSTIAELGTIAEYSPVHSTTALVFVQGQLCCLYNIWIEVRILKK